MEGSEQAIGNRFNTSLPASTKKFSMENSNKKFIMIILNTKRKSKTTFHFDIKAFT